MSRAAFVLALVVLLVGAHGRSLLEEQTIVQNQIGTGYGHVCSIKSDGSAWCWGDNNHGQLGNGETSATPVATPVKVLGGGSWLQISVGIDHTCGLKSDNTAWCWGRNEDGQLGNGGTKGSAVPTPVAGGGTWLQISSGSDHACGLKTDGSAWCWGDNENGELGSPPLTDKNIPSIVPGGHTWGQISASDWHTCVLKADSSSAWCWGYYPSDNYQYTKTAVGSGEPWLQIFAGYFYTCGIKPDRSGWCWGGGSEWITVLPNLSEPTEVPGGYSWLQFSVQEDLICGIQTDFSAWCWGNNTYGQVGDGSFGNTRPTPVKVYGGYTWKEVSAGWDHACGITQQGEAMCWGLNTDSVLGSEGPNANIPRAVAGNGPWGMEGSIPLPATPLTQPAPPPTPTPPSPPHSIVTSPQQYSTPSSSSTNIGAIVGGVVGGIAVLAAIAAFILWRKRRSSAPPPLSTEASTKSAVPPPFLQTDATQPEAMQKGPTRPEDSAALAQSISSLPSLSASADPVLQWVATSSTISSTNTKRSQPPTPPNLSSLAFNWSQARVLKPLGLGSFGKVYLGTLNHAPVALKLMIDARAAASATTASATHAGGEFDAAPAVASTDALIAEASILASIRHPNVALLVGYCLNPPCLALEYASRGSLFDVLKKAAAEPAAAAELTWSRRLGMAADAAAGMLHLHTRSPPILHRDLKSPNLLVTADWSIKVTDMGLSKVVSEASRNSSATAGGTNNPRWLAPEVLNGAKPTEAADVFSFGVVLWELLTWRMPWDDVNVWTIVRSVTSGNRLEIPPVIELPGEKADAALVAAYVALMQRCWAQAPAERPSFEVLASELRALGA